jgi:uncharacterized protein YegP (UPF0339 family)
MLEVLVSSDVIITDFQIHEPEAGKFAVNWRACFQFILECEEYKSFGSA